MGGATAVIAGAGVGFKPVSSSFTSGSGSVTIPTGAFHLVMTDWAPGDAGSGGAPFNPGPPPSGPTFGNGGPSGSLAQKTVALTSADWGKTINYSVGTPGASNGAAATQSTITNGTYTGTINMVAHGGNGAGTPGSASGGDTNTSGNSASGSAGGAALSDSGGDSAGAGGAGTSGGSGSSGSAGKCKFAFS